MTLLPPANFTAPITTASTGFRSKTNSLLFERLLLEINQAGLSWELILKKREGFRLAYDGFDVDRVAAYGDSGPCPPAGRPGHHPQSAQGRRGHRQRQRSSGGCALRTADLPAGCGRTIPCAKTEWVKLFRKTFRFTGGEITGEFLMSIGYLPSPHREDCPVYAEIARLDPPWMEVEPSFWGQTKL